MLVEVFCWLCGIAAVVLGHFTVNEIRFDAWYSFVFAILIFLGAYLIGLILMFVIYYLIGLPIKIGHEYKKPKKFYHFLFFQGVDYLCFHAKIHCRFKGQDLLPRGKKFLLVCNHKSNYDPILIAKKLRRYDFAFVSKVENFKIPLLNRYLSALCYLPVNRSDLLQSLDMLKRASNYIQNDVLSVGVFPEGKRYKAEGVGEFHEGFFNVAIKNNIPLVVCTVKNTENIAKNLPFKWSRTKVEVVRIFEPEEIAGLPAKELSDECRRLMEENLKKPYPSPRHQK